MDRVLVCAMRMVRLLLAATLPIGCATAPSSVDPARYASDAEWDACIQQTQAELGSQGKCGVSNCYDDAGRDLIDICVAEVGFLRHTDAETAQLLHEISIGGISNATAAQVRTYPPGHPVREAYATAQGKR